MKELTNVAGFSPNPIEACGTVFPSAPDKSIDLGIDGRKRIVLFKIDKTQLVNNDAGLIDISVRVAGEATVHWGDNTVTEIPATVPDYTTSNWYDATAAGTYHHKYEANAQVIYSGYILFEGEVAPTILLIGNSPYLVAVSDLYNMEGLVRLGFENSPNLKAIPSEIPSTITSLQRCFAQCTNFNPTCGINWNTENVTTFNSMFYLCNNFNQPITFSFKRATNLGNMFYYCENLDQNIDVKTSNEANSVYLDGVFQQCRRVTSDRILLLPLDKAQNSLNFTFSGVGSALDRQGTGWRGGGVKEGGLPPSRVTSYNQTFSGLSGLKNEDWETFIYDWTFEHATYLNGTFNGSSGMAGLNYPHFRLGNAELTTNFMRACDYNGSIRGWGIRPITAVSMFERTNGIEFVPEDLNLSQASWVSGLFTYATFREGTDFVTCDFGGVEIGDNMFSYTNYAGGVPVMNRLRTMNEMFRAVKTMDTDLATQFANANVQSIQGAFRDTTCFTDKTINLSYGANMTDIRWAFMNSTWKGAGNIEQLRTQNLNSIYFENAFNGSAATLDLSNWCASRVTSGVMPTNFVVGANIIQPKWGEPC